MPFEVSSITWSASIGAILVTGKDKSITALNNQLQPIELKGAFE
jgi:hypothetical protein